MTGILCQLPFAKDETMAFVGAEMIRIKPFQIVAWASVTAQDRLLPVAPTPRFPVILDPGHNHNFSIQEQQLVRWAGVQPNSLRLLGNIREAGRRVPLHAARLWLHGNIPGQRDAFADRPPKALKLPQGIAIYPSDLNYPPLPLLGLRALVRNNLHFAIDPERCVVNVGTPDWRTRLLRWLS